MAKRETEFISERPTVGGVRRIGKRGHDVPVSSYGKVRYYLRDGHYIPSWLVWLRRRRLVLVALVAVAIAVAAARLLLASRR